MEERYNQLKTAAELIREERRKYNNLLRDVVDGKATEYNAEDLMRLVGTLEAAYNHAYAIILVGELDNAVFSPLYVILAIITNGKVEPCASCKREEDNKEGE